MGLRWVEVGEFTKPVAVIQPVIFLRSCKRGSRRWLVVKKPHVFKKQKILQE